jgi:hypothetical protein
MVEYRDRDAFYAADERRKHSAEADFGSRCRDDTGASWRISWLHDTGEIYAVRLGPGLVDPGRGAVAAAAGFSSGPVAVLGRIAADANPAVSSAHVQAALTGWSEQ